jgi:hypothetical protein
MPYASRRKRLTYAQRHYRLHRKSRIKESIAYYRKHEERIKKDRAEHWKKSRLPLKITVVKHYCNGKIRCQCNGCPIRDISLLTVDHIKPIGSLRRRSLYSQNLHRWIISHNFPKGFQILCGACNLAKGASSNCPRYGKKH